MTTERYERTGSVRPAGVMATACKRRGPDATREAPAVILDVQDQPATRESQVGLFGVAERLVVPVKPGNSGGGKGPWFKDNAGSGESREIGDEPDTST